MGGCALPQPKPDTLQNTKNSSLSTKTKSISDHNLVKQGELDLIKLMYNDLACRNKDNLLTREVFDIFFHLNGLWGQVMFLNFNQTQNGTVKFE